MNHFRGVFLLLFVLTYLFSSCEKRKDGACESASDEGYWCTFQENRSRCNEGTLRYYHLDFSCRDLGYTNNDGGRYVSDRGKEHPGAIGYFVGASTILTPDFFNGLVADRPGGFSMNCSGNFRSCVEVWNCESGSEERRRFCNLACTYKSFCYMEQVEEICLELKSNYVVECCPVCDDIL